MGGTQLWEKTKNGMQIGYDTPATNGIKKTYPKNCGHISILFQGSGTPNTGSFSINLCDPSKDQ